MILIIDNFDSFTYNLVDYFQQLGQTVEVKRNNLPIEDLISAVYSGIVLSPGPGIPKDAGQLMKVIEHYHRRIPMLGICLGHQAIGEFFGGKLMKAYKPMHGKLSDVSCANNPIFVNIPSSIQVVRYHSLVCKHLPEVIEVIATTKEGEVMAMKHNDLPVYGLQFHPEAVLTEYGLEILRNWINLNHLTS